MNMHHGLHALDAPVSGDIVRIASGTAADKEKMKNNKGIEWSKPLDRLEQ